MLSEILAFGREFRTSTSRRGALIQLEGKKAYITNEKRSALFILESPEELGTGTFYSVEVPSFAKSIERRDDKVRVVLEKTLARHNVRQDLLIPDKGSISEEVEKAIKTLYTEPIVALPEMIFTLLNPSFLITEIELEKNLLRLKQTRSDGTVQFDTEVDLNVGFSEVNHEPSGKIAVFTSDLYVLRDKIKNTTSYLKQGLPISIRGNFGNMKLTGIIGQVKYED